MTAFLLSLRTSDLRGFCASVHNTSDHIPRITKGLETQNEFGAPHHRPATLLNDVVEIPDLTNLDRHIPTLIDFINGRFDYVEGYGVRKPQPLDH